MNKKLIYYWYVPAEWDKVYDLHLKNIKLYFPQYDFKEKLFTLGYNKGDYTVVPYVLKTIEKIREVVPDAKFMFYDNDPVLREAKHFYNEIAMKLGEFDEDDVIFYAHAKGKYSDYRPAQIRDLWVNLMYFGNLYNPKEIEEFINNKESICLGTLGMDTHNWKEVGAKLNDEFKVQRFQWHYSGTFFWIKPHQLKEYITKHNITIPENSRFFAECFPGNVVPFEGNESVQRYGQFDGDYAKYINDMPEKDRRDFINIHQTLTYNFQPK